MVKVGKFYLGLQNVKEVQICLLGPQAHWQMCDSSDFFYFLFCIFFPRLGEDGLNPI